MSKEKSVTIVIIYLMLVISALLYGVYLVTSTNVFKESFHLLITCVLLAGIGGVLYTMRGAYLNFSVHKQWTNEWMVWYILRPFASCICGGISYLFLKAGLLVLEAKKAPDATNLGYYALALIAGMNVDKFIAKIEEFAEKRWGIEKTRAVTGNKPSGNTN